MERRLLCGRRPETALPSPNSTWQNYGRCWSNSAPASFRQLPQTPNTCGEGSWKMERRKLLRNRPKIHLNGRNKGGVGQIQLPPASVSFRQLPRTPNKCAEGCWKMERGKLLEKRPKIPPKWGEIRAGLENFSFRQPPPASADT